MAKRKHPLRADLQAALRRLGYLALHRWEEETTRTLQIRLSSLGEPTRIGLHACLQGVVETLEEVY